MRRQKQLKIILMDKKILLHETTNLCVEIMKSKINDKYREFWSFGTNSYLPFDVSVMLNLSVAFPLTRTGMMKK